MCFVNPIALTKTKIVYNFGFLNAIGLSSSQLRKQAKGAYCHSRRCWKEGNGDNISGKHNLFQMTLSQSPVMMNIKQEPSMTKKKTG